MNFQFKKAEVSSLFEYTLSCQQPKCLSSYYSPPPHVLFSAYKDFALFDRFTVGSVSSLHCKVTSTLALLALTLETSANSLFTAFSIFTSTLRS